MCVTTGNGRPIMRQGDKGQIADSLQSQMPKICDALSYLIPKGTYTSLRVLSNSNKVNNSRGRHGIRTDASAQEQ